MPVRTLRALPLLLALAACDGPTKVEPEPVVYHTDPAAVATEWTAENPTEPAVPVTLPTTRMTPEAAPATLTGG